MMARRRHGATSLAAHRRWDAEDFCGLSVEEGGNTCGVGHDLSVTPECPEYHSFKARRRRIAHIARFPSGSSALCGVSFRFVSFVLAPVLPGPRRVCARVAPRSRAAAGRRSHANAQPQKRRARATLLDARAT